jgi:transposase
VLAPIKNAQEILDNNAKLTARLKVSDEQLRQLREEVQRLKGLQPENERLTERVVLLEEEVRWLKAQYFGSSSQKGALAVSPDQKMLFNEAEVLAAIEAADAAQAARKTQIQAHERAHTGGRKAIPKNFPRIIIPHDLPQQEKYCSQCAGYPALDYLGMEISECYRYEPPKIQVEQHQCLKYACGKCHQGVKVGSKPPQLLPKTMASPSLLAHLITSKFVDGLPLYRISQQLERSGMELNAGTAGTWVNIIGGEKAVPLINLMSEELLKISFIQMDETYVQVLKSEKAPSSPHYMVVRAAGPPGRRIILYDYVPSRTTEALKQLLIGVDGPYRGQLLTDGLERYDEICEALGILHFGCLQHCRTHFIKAQKVTELPSGRSLARVAIDEYIRQVYRVEGQIKELREAHEKRGEQLPLESVLKLRQEKSAPIMEAFKRWVDELLPGVPPNSALGKALAYTVHQWEKLSRFLSHPDIPADNNYCEQQIKSFAVGRKAWMFCDSKVGATASANLYSLVMSARANGVEPFAYLEYLFERLPQATTVEMIEALLPWNVKAALKERQKGSNSPTQSATT